MGTLRGEEAGVVAQSARGGQDLFGVPVLKGGGVAKFSGARPDHREGRGEATHHALRASGRATRVRCAQLHIQKLLLPSYRVLQAVRHWVGIRI